MPTIPLLHGNWVDLLLLLILLWFFFDGLGRGFLKNAVGLLGFIVSFLVALKFYSFFSFLLIGNFSFPKGIADALGFFIAASLGEFVFSTLAALLLAKVPKNYVVNSLNKSLGFIPSVLNGLIISAFLLTILVSLPVNPIIKNAILSSRLGSPLVSKTQNLEREINRIFGGALNETLNFLTVRQEGSENIDLHFKVSDYQNDEAAEQKMFSLVNEERKKQGVRELSFDAKLQSVARAHAKDMLLRGYFSHNSPEGLTPFDRMKNAGIVYDTAGENLAFAPTVDISHTGLMNSPGHRANILSADFGKVGIGVLSAGIYGEMFVQEFTN